MLGISRFNDDTSGESSAHICVCLVSSAMVGFYIRTINVHLLEFFFIGISILFILAAFYYLEVKPELASREKDTSKIITVVKSEVSSTDAKPLLKPAKEEIPLRENQAIKSAKADQHATEPQKTP